MRPFVAVLIILVAVAISCGESADEPSYDAAAESGCRHLIAVMKDSYDGVLTQEQFLRKVDEAYQDLQLSDSTSIAVYAGTFRKFAFQYPSSAMRSRTSPIIQECADVVVETSK